MTTLSLLGLPLLSLLVRCAVGAGLTTILARRLPHDVQAALVPLVGTAALVVASQLLKLGAPVRVLTAVVLVLGAALTLARIGPVLRALRRGAVPLAIALVAMALAGGPGIERGDWSAATWGNADPYLWVSQAKTYLDGEGAAASPDRLASERLEVLHWRSALPFDVARLAALSGRDPVDVYGAFAAVVALLVPLAAYAAARAALGLGVAGAALAALALAANAQLLLGSLGGWQAQLMLTAFALAAAALLSVALGRSGSRRELALAGLFGAATLSTYGPAAAAFLGLATGGVALGYVLAHRHDAGRALRAVALFASAASFLALPALVDSTRSVLRFAGQLHEEDWRSLARPLPSEPLGLLARDGGLRPAGSPLWSLAGLLLAVALIALAAVALRRARRHELVLGPALLVLVSVALLDVAGASPYVSFKLMAYGAPFLSLLVVAGLLRLGRTPLGLVAGVAFAAMAVTSTAGVVSHAREARVSAADLAGLRGVAPGEPIAVSTAEPWRQSWALYYLRDRAVSVPEPSVYLTGMGWRRDARSFARPTSLRLAPDEHADAVWRGGGLALVRDR